MNVLLHFFADQVFIHVSFHMSSQILGPFEGFAAISIEAAVMFGLGVHNFMLVETTFKCKCFTAHFTCLCGICAFLCAQ